jgi:DNA-binding response OmpR family regulator
LEVPGEIPVTIKNILFTGKTSLPEFDILIVLNGEQKMKSEKKRVVQLIGNDSDLNYLLGRFAEQSECKVAIAPANTSMREIEAADPTAIIFLSVELLAAAQTLVAGLTSLDLPIIVCSSVTDEARARELGADSCLLHPITYDGFQHALAFVAPSRRD